MFEIFARAGRWLGLVIANMSGTGGRIPETAFKVRMLDAHYPLLGVVVLTDVLFLKSILGGLFGIAMIAAAARTALRLKQHGRLFFDDSLLLVACIFLTAGTIITYLVTPSLYVPYSDFRLFHPNEFQRRVIWFQRMVFAFISLTWVVIFAVKLSFMYFFRGLVDRLTNMVLYWRIVLGAMAVSFAVCVSEAAMECPVFDVSSGTLLMFPFEYNETLD